MLDIVFASAALPRAGALVLPLVEEAALSGLGAAADQATGGAIARALAAAEFKGAKGKTCVVLAPGGGLTRVVAVGLGKSADLTPRRVEEAGGTAAAAVARETEAAVAADGLDPAQAAAFGLGAVLRAYRFDKYRTKEKPEDKPRLARLTVLGADPEAARSRFAPLGKLAEGVFLTRDLVTEPPNVLNPAEFAERCRPLAALGLEVEIMGPEELRKLGFGALLGVSQGSANEPRMVVMRWNGGPAGDQAGRLHRQGRHLRHRRHQHQAGAGGMEDMKWDMAGAGTVIGLMAALAGRRAKVNAVGLVGLVENMPSGTAQRPGDVVTSYSGQTIEIINTDAEGRLVLADVLWYCQKTFDPVFMVDLATLTGAIIVALGHEYAGMFANNDELAARLEAAGKATGEAVWRMPLGEAYDKQIKSDIADMKNVGGRPGGSITAAQFLQRFVAGKPWAHLDIAGMAWSSKDTACTPKGATAFGVRLLDRLVAEHYETADR